MSRRRVANPGAAGLALVCAVAVVAAGCGYALVGRGSNIPEDVRTVYVAPFDNQTARSKLDIFMTNSIAQEMVTRGRFRLAAAAEGADAVLSGAVSGFVVRPVAFNANGRATQYEISITAKVLFRRPGDDGEVLWKNDRYLFRESYDVEESEIDFFDQQDQALEEATVRFAETMVSDLLEGF